MGQPFASGKHAVGICDRCGFEYKLHDLKPEVVDLHVTGLLVCPECWDPDQPQLQLGRWPVSDPQAIRNPRPPQGLEQSRYGDALRYDFLTSDDGFNLNYNGTSVGEVSYNSTSQTIISSPDDSTLGRTLFNGIISPDILVDTSVYNSVSVRFKVNTPPTPDQNSSYLGYMYWRNTSGGGSYTYAMESKSNPDWFQMGDPYQVLTWDVGGNPGWTGTVKGAFWNFFSIVTTSGEYEIDYVRFLRAPRENP